MKIYPEHEHTEVFLLATELSFGTEATIGCQDSDIDIKVVNNKAFVDGLKIYPGTRDIENRDEVSKIVLNLDMDKNELSLTCGKKLTIPEALKGFEESIKALMFSIYTSTMFDLVFCVGDYDKLDEFDKCMKEKFDNIEIVVK